MDRGDVVIVSGRGDYGKPRPAAVVQNNQLLRRIESITVCFVTSDLSKESLLRVSVDPDEANGLRVRSQIQIEKIMTFPSEKVKGPIGRVSPDNLRAVDMGLLFHLDLVQPFDMTVGP
ncbi:MAG TPA: type II toxin-antitoxin system PemK/MazF family toxin [Pararhizobium sp.]|nr:type II toxin-antitoxin system PemK/MazF family toxin [Pararhizobium sp.]